MSNPEELLEMSKMAMAQYKYYVLLFMVILIIVVLLFYISYKFGLKKQNCKTIEKQDTSKPLNLTSINESYNKPLGQYFIKTAYNCFCSGNFKNDYVDECALKNVANYGVRALDFQIYSLNNKPIISASTVDNTKYKEIYNYIPFNDALIQIKKHFMNTSVNRSDPLFLIFRLYTINYVVYDLMGDILNQTFGYGTPGKGNKIFLLAPNQTLDSVQLNKLIGKVVIIVDATNGDPAKFNSSKLHLYTSLALGTRTNKIYREDDIITSVSLHKTYLVDISNNLNVLYPNLEYSSLNYDFVTTGINNGISFIGMNFQKNDTYLKEYNSIFKTFSFANKSDTINLLCKDPNYKSMTNCPVIK